MVKKLNLLILLSIFTSFTFGSEIIDEDYIFNPNLNSESLPSKPKQNKNLAGTIVTESVTILLEYGSALGLGTVTGAATAFALAIDTFSYGIIPTYKKGPEGAIGYFIGSTIGSTLGTYLIGLLFHRRGRFFPTLVGSSLGTLSCLSLFLTLSSKNEIPDFYFTVLLLTPPAGAVIGYNLSRIKRKTKLSLLEEHFDQPYFSLRAERTKENEIIPVFDLRLVNARF